ARMTEISTWLPPNGVHRTRSSYCHPRGLYSLGCKKVHIDETMTWHERKIAHVIPHEVNILFIQCLV
ncbi:hypothetical protein V1506DRAFT_463538, partial [Lipomyces tetrasporus]